MTFPKLATSTPTTSPSRITFDLEGVPPNWLNWSRGLKERISMRHSWRDITWTAALIARRMANWAPATQDEVREVNVVVFRVKELDHDGLWASVKPVIDGLKTCQSQRVTKRRYVTVQGSGLIYDDAPRYVRWRPWQVLVDHYDEEKVIVEVCRVDSDLR